MKNYVVEWSFYGEHLRNYDTVHANSEEDAMLAIMEEHPNKIAWPYRAWQVIE